MKNFTKKIICSFILFLLLVNSNILLIISNAIDIIENQEDEKKANVIAELLLEKYCNYELSEENKGTFVQINLKTGINYAEGQEYKPLKSTEVILSSPKIEGNYPKNAEIIAKSTKATNGKEDNIQPNYEYNNKSGELRIYTSNEADENGNFYNENNENALDEYKVLYYYDSSCYDAENKKRNIEITANVKESIYDDNESLIETSCNINENVTENIGGLISTNITTSDIYNGYINANKENGTNYQTEYLENTEIEVSYKEIADKIQIAENNKFINTKDEEIETDKIIYKSTSINKNEILNILGNDGYLQILNENGEKLLEVNKDTEADENGIVNIVYENEITKILVNTSKPQNIGNINIKNAKVIKETMTDVNNNKIKVSQTIKALNNTQPEDVYENVNNNIVEIKNSQTAIDISIDKTELTNDIQNDVVFTATLLTNDVKYNLFKNPTILITMPQEVDDVILGETSLLYDNNMNIKNAEVIDTNGIKAIKIELEGTQNNYIYNYMVDGAEIIIPSTIILKKEIESINTNIKAQYTNNIGTINDYEIEGKQTKDINITISSIISENQTAVIYYNTNSISENIISTNSGLNFEVIAQVGDKVLSEGDIVHEHEIIKYTVKITNTTSSNINNIKIDGNIPNGTSYATISYGNGNDAEKLYEYIKDDSVTKYEETINIIKANETVEKYYEVEVNELEENEQEKNTESIIRVYENDSEIYNNSITNIIKEGKITVRVQSTQDQSLLYGVSYAVWIYNNTNEDIKNVTAEIELPKELKLIESLIYLDGGSNSTEDDITEEDGKITIKLDKINAKNESEEIEKNKADIILTTRHVNLINNVYEYELKASAKVTYDNDDNTYWSNENRITSYIEGIEIVQTSEQEGKELKYGDEIEYNITIKNVGKSKDKDYTSINIIDFLPKNIDPISAEYEGYKYNSEDGTCFESTQSFDLTSKITEEGEDEDTVPNIDIITPIPMGKEATLKIKATAGIVSEKTEVSNTLTVSGDTIETKISNTIKFKILPLSESNNEGNNGNNNGENNGDNNGGNNDNSGDNNTENTYKINGLVWVDSNKDGKRDSEEELLPNVSVKLYNTETSAIIKDKNGNSAITTTNEEGRYEFTEINKGKYLVLFEYDTNYYTPTSYQKIGASEKINSDVIKKDVVIDGTKKTVAVTDIIDIKSSNIENIDMGLIKNPIYNLSLEKYITRINVQDGKGEKEYIYEDSKLAKVEISSRQLKNTTLEIEYKIVVKNEGDVEAYVNSIVDYLPNGLTFDKGLNKSWNKNSNNTVTTSELAKIRILPGEIKEVTLVLTKDMTEDSTGTITNRAEIAKSINKDNLQDKNPEDDYSEAQVIISINTGVITYSLLLIIIIAVLFIIRKLIIDKKIKLKQLMILIIGVISISAFMIPNYSNASIESDIKKAAKDKYKSSATKTIYTGADIFSTHTDAEEVYVNKYKYHCQDGNKSMCTYGNHYYKQDSIDVSVIGGVIGAKMRYEIFCDDSKVTLSHHDLNYNKLGPYTISSFGGVGSSISISAVYDGNGNSVNFIANPTMLGEFYIYVPKNVYNVSRVDVKISTKITVTYSATVNVTEQWRAVRVSGEHGGFGCTDYTKCQPLGRYRRGIDIDIDKEETETKTFKLKGGTLPTGSIALYKKDGSTGKDVNGASFTVTGPLSTAWSQTRTYNNVTSPFTISSLDLGMYEIKEIKAPNGYDSFQLVTTTTTVNANQTSNVIITNRKYGDLQVKKVDKETGTVLNGAIFRISYIDNGVRKYINSYTRSDSGASTIGYTTDLAGAKQFISGENGSGIVYLKNIPVGTYTIEEIGFTTQSGLAQYYDAGLVKNITVKSHAEEQVAYCNIENPQKYVDLSGYIWEDIGNGKGSGYNYLHDNHENIQNVTEIKVELKDKNTGQVVRDKNGNLCQTYGNNGNNGYKFSSVPIYDSAGNYILSNYYVEFTYNGLKYESFKTVNLNVANGSKAKENNSTRETFNDTYKSISGDSTRGETTTGYSENNNQQTNKLTYESTDDGKSELISKLKYKAEDSHVQTQNGSTGIKITANTNETGYVIKRYTGSPTGQQVVKEIKNINLGIYERTQPDLAIQNDISTIKMTLKDEEGSEYTHVYNYSQRDEYISTNTKSDGTLISENDDGYNSRLDGFSPIVKQGNAYKKSYTRDVYKSFVNYNIVNNNDENRLHIYVTYKVTIANHSTNLKVIVDELTDYFDGKNLIINSDNMTLSEENYKNTGYDVAEIKTDSLTIDPQKSVQLNLTFEVNNESIKKLLDGNFTSDNIVEISKYSALDEKGNVYGGIDKDSAPRNVIPGKEDTYEDDTDAAPSLTIKLAEEKKISGTIFEDYTDPELQTGNERIGDGKNDAQDTGTVGNVEVELMRIKSDGTEEVAKLYPSDGEAKNAIQITNGDGKYEFDGLIPGKYVLKYTYGDGTIIYNNGEQKNVTLQDYKSTIVTSNEIKKYLENEANNDENHWYWYVSKIGNITQNKYSVAVDDYSKRLEINNKFSIINYGKQTNYTDENEYQEYKTITANTPQLKIEIEDKNYPEGSDYGAEFECNYQNIDFGIVERPRASINLTKDIAYIKLVLSNGQVLIDGDPRNDTLQHVTYPNGGILKIEVDNEILQGAKLDITYEIKVDNKSELNYNTEDYYKYGNAGNIPVGLTINKVVDYLDEKLVTEQYDNKVEMNNWYQISSNSLRDSNIPENNNISDKVYRKIQNRSRIYLANEMLSLQNMMPDTSNTIQINATKLLTNTSNDEDLIFENHTEVVQYSNIVGRFYETYNSSDTTQREKATPGNYEIDSDINETDSNKDNYEHATVVITPPTGQQRLYFNIGIGIMSMVILATGVVIIKKKVL